MMRCRAWLMILTVMMLGFSAPAADLPLERIVLPPGFRIDLLAKVANARQMALGDKNVLFVGSMAEGSVVAIQLDAGYRPQKTYRIASGLNMPVGVAYRAGTLYVSAVSRILRYDDIEARLAHPPVPVVVTDELPAETHHGWKFIGFGPDGWLYVPVGAPCNICEPDPDRYAAILRMKPDGSSLQIFARGIRNSVGFDWNPRDKTLWFTDNGRDMLGDDLPGDELDHAARAGMHFGYPYCHAGTTADPEFGNKRACVEFAAPALDLGPHVAALGMRFYKGTMFPAEYRNAIFIAEHGSWNRTRKVGYRVVAVHLEGDKAVSHDVFASGWLQAENAWGRPADVLTLPDGSLLVSDDLAGAVYRISYGARRQ